MTSSLVRKFPIRDGVVGTFAAVVRVECARRGLKQSDLARSLGVSQSMVSKKWLGERAWQLDEMESIGAALGVPVARLLEYTARDLNPEPADSVSGVVIAGPWAEAVAS